MLARTTRQILRCTRKLMNRPAAWQVFSESAMEDLSTSPWAQMIASIEADRDRAWPPAHLRARVERLSRLLLAFLFPHFRADDCADHGDLAAEYHAICMLLESVVQPLVPDVALTCERMRTLLAERLPPVRELLLADAEAMRRSDPAAHDVDEIIMAYPGFLAIALHRIAHEFSMLGVPIVPRLISEYAHRETGIDIHPGAKIGREFSIDHGTGVVIGETSVIGDRVRIYQGVTLGALVVEKNLADVKRHPTLEDDVVIYAGATILGGRTVVGKGSVIGGNVWLVRSIPPGTTLTQEPQQFRRDPFPLEFQI